jgi:hypothetical protein
VFQGRRLNIKENTDSNNQHITEILLKLAFNTITPTQKDLVILYYCIFFFPGG